MFNLKIIKPFRFISLIFSLGLTSCVGTVSDKNAKQSTVQSSTSSSASSSFSGLQGARPISNDKIELEFYPAEGDPAKLTYEIYVNNSPLPLKIAGRSLSTTSTGLYYFVINGLSLQTLYTFNMRVVEADNETKAVKLDPSKSISAKTFSNETADFLGVSSLTLGSGENGKNTILVKWIPATITGTSLNLRQRDPVAYEISYISQLGGLSNLNNLNYKGSDRVVITTPNPLSSPPALNLDREYTLTGLIPNTDYYVQVRAIHKGYVTNSLTDDFYKKEMNTHFLKIKTLASGSLFEFNASLAYLNNPIGEIGLTNLDISWIPASGEFNHYRICYRQVAAPDDPEPFIDYLSETDIENILNNTSSCIQKSSQTTNFRLNGLTSYAYYQVKVLACKTVGCESNNRINSDLTQKRIISNVAPFNGITNILNPNDENLLTQVTVQFNPVVTGAGYLNRFKLYCYSSTSDASPVEISLNGVASSATGKPSCDGIKSITSLPAQYSSYENFDNLILELPVINGSARYCLSLLPSIYSPYLNQENLSNAIVKCFTPQVKTPTIAQFSGRTNNCIVNEKSMDLSWNLPTGGLYSKYLILYREKNLSTDFFNFTTATSDYIANKTNNSSLSDYKSIDNIDKATLSYTLNSLVPGRNYGVGVLTYLDDGSSKIFSQYNLNIGDCAIPLPTPNFDEWVDIFAIGPKEDGLTPVSSYGAHKNIIETLDDDGIPVEVATLNNDEITIDTSNALANNRKGSLLFNGVYGAKDSLESNPIQQYSNSGIIRFGWKDVSFYANSEKLNDYISNTLYEKTPAVKSSRKFGYKVYRSEDNQLTWVDMTKKSTLNNFQSVGNEGLVHPSSFGWKERNNATTITENITFFTDYSVKFSGIDGEIDRARTYWYKVIPVFDGKELAYNSTANSSHHIIRVTLPPRNMALVHRMIANRTLCLEMNKSLNKNSGQYYSCDYNGVGSSGLQVPWTVGNTVYDQGGDLLIDRFELSCPFTRGDINRVNSDSEFGGTKLTFAGASTYNNNFKGCFNNLSGNFEPNNGPPLAVGNYLYNQVIPGDCFGNDTSNKAYYKSTACSDPARVISHYYIYPGSNGLDNSLDCNIDTSRNGPNFTDMTNPSSLISSFPAFFPTQSEYAAVYYMRSNYRHQNDSYHIPAKLQGAGQTLTYSTDQLPSSCSVNLGYKNSVGEYRPRWIPLNSLFGNMKDGANNSLILYNKKISEIKSEASLYNNSTTKAPENALLNLKRMSNDSTLIRIATSNSAKLPPLDGFSQLDLYNTCSTYKVQVGIETKTNSFYALDSVKQKRLMRKKESTVAAAWPQQYDSSKVNNIESGAYAEGAINNSCNSLNKPSPVGTDDYQKAQLITPLFPQDSKSNPLLMVGSSSRDPGSTLSNTEKCVSRFGIQDLAGNMRETNADEIFCDYAQDQLYLGNIVNNLNESTIISGGSSSLFNPNNVTPWVLSSTQSGSCSLNESGASKSAIYTFGVSNMSSLYNYLGLNTSLIQKIKPFDQEAILSGRNGDGTFLAFGQGNLGPSLKEFGALAMEDSNPSDAIIPAIQGKFFNPVLGIPLSCGGNGAPSGSGCDTNGSDNSSIISEKLATSIVYDTINNPLNLSLTDFPTNNSQISSAGVSEIYQGATIDSNDPDTAAFNYIDSIDLGGDANDPADNFATTLTSTPNSSSPGVVDLAYFKVSRSASLKMYTGGGSLTESGRYTMDLEGRDSIYEKATTYQSGGRCAIMINND